MSAQTIGGNGTGGSISLFASSGSTTGNLTLNSNIDASQSGSGMGGLVGLTNAYSSGTITINGNINVNGATGGDVGIGTISSTPGAPASGGITIEPGISITANGTAGSGGAVQLQSQANIDDMGAVPLHLLEQQPLLLMLEALEPIMVEISVFKHSLWSCLVLIIPYNRLVSMLLGPVMVVSL